MNCLQQLIFSLSSDRLFKRYVSTSLSERKLILVTTDFSITFPQKLYKFSLFLKLGSLQVLPWNLRQLIAYFFALIIYSINLLKTARKTFATGNAIYPLPRTIIQITNDNSIFCKEGIAPEFIIGFLWGSCCSIYSFQNFCVVFCRLLFVLLSLVLPLYCLSFFDLRF